MLEIPYIRKAAAWALALGFLVAGGVRAADPAVPTDAKRAVVVLKHRQAKDLAAVLGPYFKDAALIQGLPGSPDEVLLIRASPSVYDEVMAAVDKLDRAPKTVSVELFIAQAAPPADADKKPDGEKPAPAEAVVKESDLTGPTAEVAARLEEMRSKGLLTDLKRVHLTVTEGRTSSILAGENKPYTTGVMRVATGAAARSISYRNVGTEVQASAIVSPDGAVSVDLHLQDMTADTPPDGVPIGADEKNNPVFATDFFVTHWEGKISIPAGQARPLESVHSTDKNDRLRTFIVAAVQVLDADAKPPK
ncbi:MAG TPA: hypothetical protein VMS17_17915 [Gemmataceae bacterium]|nr:hypothetical protein [Gemmataceae bacterium]